MPCKLYPKDLNYCTQKTDPDVLCKLSPKDFFPRKQTLDIPCCLQRIFIFLENRLWLSMQMVPKGFFPRKQTLTFHAASKGSLFSWKTDSNIPCKLSPKNLIFSKKTDTDMPCKLTEKEKTKKKNDYVNCLQWIFSQKTDSDMSWKWSAMYIIFPR